MERIKTGLEKLDKLLGGGLPENTVILVSGGPGTGKTLFGLNYILEGAKNGENCCYLTLNENKKDILRACQIEKLKNIHRYTDKNLAIEELRMEDQNDLTYFKKLFRQYPKTDRLVLDNINKLLMYAKDKKEYRTTLSKTVTYFREHIGSTILICETEKDRLDSGNGEAFECDGVLHISFSELEEKPKRTLEIDKMRYTRFDAKIQHELAINNKGLELTETKII